ncbi:MAG: ABC transporter substrate-binding protein [Bacilli bacterium]|jgi:oligopeptide transport system substrate-binding protein
MKNRKFGFVVGMAVLSLLTSCGNGGGGDVVVDTSFTANNHKDYAGYSADVNGDGTVSSDEKGLTWAESYDKIIATVKSSSDSAKRFKLMHIAETLLMSTGGINPLYNYTDIYMKAKGLTGLYTTPLGFKYFQDCELNGKKEFTVSVGPNPDTIDPALNSAVDGATYIIHAFSGLMKFQEKADKSGVELACDIAEDGFSIDDAKYRTDNSDGSITYHIPLKKNLKWSDGTSYDANAFVYSWNRAASGKLGADYGYMFDVIKGYEDASADATGEKKLAVSASDDGNTLDVTINNYVPYFAELLAFPAYMPVKEDIVSKDTTDGEWATNVSTYIGNGPMKITKWEANSAIVFERNSNYHGSACKADKITFALSDDDTALLTNFKSGDWSFIDSVPNDQIDSLKASYKDEFIVAGQLGTYYTCLNMKDGTFNKVCDTEEKRVLVRKALSLLIDRNYICTSIGKAGQTPANGFVATGLSDPEGGEFVDHNGENGDGSGYYSVKAEDLDSNREKAVSMIKEAGYTYDESTKKFTNFPKITYITNNGSGHVAIAEYLQATYADYGIGMDIQKQEWADFLQTRKAGGYSMARNGWLADYNDPISFLDMWTTNSGNNDCQFGR